MTLQKNIIKSLISLRGATTHQIDDHFAHKGYETTEYSVSINLHLLRKQGLAYNIKQPCSCCRKEVNYWYASDEAKTIFG